MSKQVGLDMYLCRNTGSFGSPVWAIIENVRDLTGSDSFAEADVSRRNTAASNAGIMQKEPTLREMSFEWDMVYDHTDADFAAIQTAYYAKTLMELAFADGLIATTGTTYLRVECKFFECSRNESLTDANIYHIVAKPSYSSNAMGVTTV